jgi:hypothetical protein
MQRKSGAPKSDEIEVTPAMIEAGMHAYWQEANPGLEEGDDADRRRILEAVFIAMLTEPTARFLSREQRATADLP